AVHQKGSLVAPPAFFLASTQPQVMPEFQLPRHLDQMFLTDQMRPQFRKLPFSKMGKAVKQLLRRNQPQDGVSQELKLLVVSHPCGCLDLQRFEFASLRAVGERLFQQLRSRELISQSLLQFRNVPRFHDPWLNESDCIPPV